MEQRKTVSIGIAAHNEERNIGTLLESIICQVRDGFVLEKVIVACDGCTDRTAIIAGEYQYRLPELQILDDGERMGQGQRISRFFVDNTSDILVTLDADTALGSRTSLAAFVREFSMDSQVGMVAGGDRPYPPRTFFESVAVTVVDLWREMRQGYNGGDTVHNSHGCALSFSHAFTREVRIPKGFNGVDHYTYFRSKELGLGFRYAKDAVVYYREPDNLGDFIHQRSRFHVINDKMAEIFGGWVEPYYASLPYVRKICAIWRMFLRQPFLLILALSLEVFMRIYIQFRHPDPVGSVWETVQSTK